MKFLIILSTLVFFSCTTRTSYEATGHSGASAGQAANQLPPAGVPVIIPAPYP